MDSSSTISNSILWGNFAQAVDGSEISLRRSATSTTLTVSYSTVTGGAEAVYVQEGCTLDWGEGNSDEDPWLTPDSHLRSGSPCIDTGTSSYAPTTDRDGETRPDGDGFDIGSDEFIDTDGDGLPDWWEDKYFGSITVAAPNEDPDFDNIINLDEYELYSSNPNAPSIYVDIDNINDPLADGTAAHPFWKIQDGIDTVGDGDTVLVAAGTYTGVRNRDLDFGGKRITVYAPAGPAATIIDCENNGRGFDFHSGETRAAVVFGFTIQNGQADYGGAIRCESSSPQIRNCRLTDNNAMEEGDGLYCNLSSPLLADCRISDNSPEGVRIYNGSSEIVGTVELETNNWIGSNLIFYGSGTLQIHTDVTLTLVNTRILCVVDGPGTTEVPADSELIVQGDAIIDLDGGTLQCDGLLQVKENAVITNSVIHVNYFSFEDNATITNNEIYTKVISPYGQYFVEDTAIVVGNDIHAEGDRFIDLDPTSFGGIIADNRIYMTIIEGVGLVRGGLLELRGLDYFCAEPPCLPGALFRNKVPVFDPNTWTLEELRLVNGAKVNLTNRFDYHHPFDQGGDEEVLFVKKLVLGEGSILNTAFNRMYYETLEGDPNNITNQPLLGFSLINIAMNDEIEFLVRVRHNNYIHPTDPNADRIHVQRVENELPDINGMMRMCNLIDNDPDSPHYQQAVNARAKGVFAQTSEEEILIRFEYLFGSSEPGVELAIYLSDAPRLLGHDNPRRTSHYRQVARLPAPPPGRPGSAGSGRFGIFEKSVPIGNLNFIRGTRIELELIGPEGTCVLIDNWDPYVYCLYCMDTDGEMGVTATDYLTVVGEYGLQASDLNEFGQSIGCLDSIFCNDGYVNLNDLLIWDWLNLVSEDAGNLCFDIPFTQNTSNSQDSSFGMLDIPAWQGEVTEIDSSLLLIAGKRFHRISTWEADYLSDRLYGFDEQGNCLTGSIQLSKDRLNGRLVRDSQDNIYQINHEDGLVRLSDEYPVVEPASRTYSKQDPLYGQKGSVVHIGLQGQEVNWRGRPILDAAFGPNGYVYVVPVVVEPQDRPSYLAAARLELDPNEFLSYCVEQIYADLSPWNDNQDPNHLREIEVDDAGNVYVLNSHHLNESDILWIYDNQGQKVLRCPLQDPNLGISAPIAMCLSRYDDSTMYVASSENRPQTNSTFVYGLPRESLPTPDPNLIRAIEIQGMGHITGITENPATGTLWVVGFNMPTIPSQISPGMNPFYYPCLAKIPYGNSGPVSVSRLDTNSDLKLPISFLWAGKKCGGADLDGSGDVNYPDLFFLAQHWLKDETDPDWLAEYDLDNNGEINISDFAVMSQHWLQAGCTNP